MTPKGRFARTSGPLFFIVLVDKILLSNSGTTNNHPNSFLRLLRLFAADPLPESTGASPSEILNTPLLNLADGTKGATSATGPLASLLFFIDRQSAPV